MVVDNLLHINLSTLLCVYAGATYQEVMFGVLEDHVYRLVLEDDLLERDDVLMCDLSVQLPDMDVP